MTPQEVRRALWLLVLGFVIAMVACLQHGCALDADLPGHGDPHKQAGRGDDELDQVDELDPLPDAGTKPSDAGGRFEDVPAAPPDAPPVDAGPIQTGLSGRWQVKLTRTHGDGCSGLPAAELATWTLAADLGTLDTPEGVLRRLETDYYQGGAPLTDVLLDDGMQGERHVSGRAGCVEIWAFEGSR